MSSAPIRSFVKPILVLVLLGVSSAGSAWAESQLTPCNDDPKSWVITRHELMIGGKSIRYTATLGFLEIAVDHGLFAPAWSGGSNSDSNSSGATPGGDFPKACVFFTEYQVQDGGNASPRPLTFVFNGGPGSASLWQHLGIMGPKRVKTTDDGVKSALPFQLEDNPDSPLDLTDIVLIDPVATGFSFAESQDGTKEFLGVKNDAESIATFIRDFMIRSRRENSPLYVAGESYGGIRGSLVTQLLQHPLYLPVQGLVLFSPWLSTVATDFGSDDLDIAYYAYLPSFATTAWYHQRSAARFHAMSLDEVFKEARKFAFGPYRDALAKGNRLKRDSAEFHSVAQQVSELIGIPQERIEKLRLRVKDSDFFALLLEDESQVIGAYDSRAVGPRLSHQNGGSASDPSDGLLSFAYVPAINAYLRNDLGWTAPGNYVDTANVSDWPFNNDGTPFVATHNLSQALADNPGLQVFIASGYYDLVCPMGSVEYERDRIDPASHGRKRVAIHPYPGGHMMYFNPVAAHQIKVDLTAFYGPAPALAPKTPN